MHPHERDPMRPELDGEDREVSIRPHLVPVITTEHIVSQLKELRGCCVLANCGEEGV